MNEKFLKYLVSNGLLSQAQADLLRNEHKEKGRSVRELILEQSLLS